MGIDLGVKETAVVAFGDEKIIFHNINKSKKVKDLIKKKKKLQRSISRKYEANKQGEKYIKTNNIIREEKKFRKICYKLNGIRSNYNHQITSKLVKLFPSQIVIEDLNIAGMMKNKHLARAIQEQSFYEIIRQLEYKCKFNNIPLYRADRFYPSSKTCSKCDNIKKDLKLSDRTYVCPECGLVIDRDYNAALNLQRYKV